MSAAFGRRRTIQIGIAIAAATVATVATAETAEIVVIAAVITIVIEVRDLIAAVRALADLAVAPSMTPMKPIAGRLLPSESATTESRTWQRACCPSGDLMTTTPPGNVTGIAIVTVTVTATVTVTVTDGTGIASETGIGNAIGIESVTESVPTESTNVGRVGTTRSTTTTERGGLAPKTERDCTVGAWTAMSASCPTVTRGPALPVGGAPMTKIPIDEIRETQRYDHVEMLPNPLD